MSDMFSTYFLETYAREHYADLLAEAEKARLIKQALGHPKARRASRTREVQLKLRSMLAVLASYISQILN